MPIRDTLIPLASSRTLGYVAVLALIVGAYSLLPLWKEHSEFHGVGDIPSELHAALSLVLGLLLVFRTNSAYSRWWEARILWGGLVNVSRNLTLKLVTLSPVTDEQFQPIAELLKEFPIALKNHLRCATSAGGLSNGPSSVHQPLQIAQKLQQWVVHQKQSGRLDGDEFRAIDLEWSKLMDICGGCERIAKTPMIRSYRVFSRQCIILFLLSLPWGIAHDFGWWTVPLTVITSYFMIGLEIVAEHVEEPFGLDEDDLDLESLCLTIEKSVGEIVVSHRMSKG